MKLLIFNGSPKGEKGNSGLISDFIFEGANKNSKVNILCLNKIKNHDEYVHAIESADKLLIVFPLYSDSMPGIVKAFIEKLEPLKGQLNNKSIGFVVHSGFPEVYQSRSVERYLEWLAKELEINYLGTMIYGNGAGLSSMPKFMIKKQREAFIKLGEEATSLEKFNEDTLRKLIVVEKLSEKEAKRMERIFNLGFGDIMWNIMLLKGKGYSNRYNKPYY